MLFYKKIKRKDYIVNSEDYNFQNDVYIPITRDLYLERNIIKRYINALFFFFKDLSNIYYFFLIILFFFNLLTFGFYYNIFYFVFEIIIFIIFYYFLKLINVFIFYLEIIISFFFDIIFFILFFKFNNLIRFKNKIKVIIKFLFYFLINLFLYSIMFIKIFYYYFKIFIIFMLKLIKYLLILIYLFFIYLIFFVFKFISIIFFLQIYFIFFLIYLLYFFIYLIFIINFLIYNKKYYYINFKKYYNNIKFLIKRKFKIIRINNKFTKNKEYYINKKIKIQNYIIKFILFFIFIYELIFYNWNNKIFYERFTFHIWEDIPNDGSDYQNWQANYIYIKYYSERVFFGITGYLYWFIYVWVYKILIPGSQLFHKINWEMELYEIKALTKWDLTLVEEWLYYFYKVFWLLFISNYNEMHRRNIYLDIYSYWFYFIKEDLILYYFQFTLLYIYCFYFIKRIIYKKIIFKLYLFLDYLFIFYFYFSKLNLIYYFYKKFYKNSYLIVIKNLNKLWKYICYIYYFIKQYIFYVLFLLKKIYIFLKTKKLKNKKILKKKKKNIFYSFLLKRNVNLKKNIYLYFSFFFFLFINFLIKIIYYFYYLFEHEKIYSYFNLKKNKIQIKRSIKLKNLWNSELYINKMELRNIKSEQHYLFFKRLLYIKKFESWIYYVTLENTLYKKIKLMTSYYKGKSLKKFNWYDRLMGIPAVFRKSRKLYRNFIALKKLEKKKKRSFYKKKKIKYYSLLNKKKNVYK